MKITYTADDGTVFDNERECLEYEGWNTDAFRYWETWARENGGEDCFDYTQRWKEVYGPWLANESLMTPTDLVWSALSDTLGLRGAWTCREGLIAIGEAMKEANRRG